MKLLSLAAVSVGCILGLGGCEPGNGGNGTDPKVVASLCDELNTTITSLQTTRRSCLTGQDAQNVAMLAEATFTSAECAALYGGCSVSWVKDVQTISTCLKNLPTNCAGEQEIEAWGIQLQLCFFNIESVLAARATECPSPSGAPTPTQLCDTALKTFARVNAEKGSCLTPEERQDLADATSTIGTVSECAFEMALCSPRALSDAKAALACYDTLPACGPGTPSQGDAWHRELAGCLAKTAVLSQISTCPENRDVVDICEDLPWHLEYEESSMSSRRGTCTGAEALFSIPDINLTTDGLSACTSAAQPCPDSWRQAANTYLNCFEDLERLGTCSPAISVEWSATAVRCQTAGNALKAASSCLTLP